MLAFPERDRLARPQIVAENFGQELPSAADLRREPLADDIAKGIGQTNAQLLVLRLTKTSRGYG